MPVLPAMKRGDKALMLGLWSVILAVLLGLLIAGCGDDKPASVPAESPPSLSQKLEKACGESYIHDLEVSDNPTFDKYIIVCADRRVVFIQDNE